MVEAGCRFIAISGDQRRVLGEVMKHREPRQATTLHSLLREFDWDDPAEPTPFWRRWLRKAS